MAKGSKEETARISLCDGDFSLSHDGKFYLLSKARRNDYPEGHHRYWQPYPFYAKTLTELQERVLHFFGVAGRYVTQDIDAQLRTQSLLIPMQPSTITSAEEAKPLPGASEPTN
jgi:hypothetical protein